MREYLRSEKWAMDPTKLAAYSANTMAAATAEEYAREIAQREMPAGLAIYVKEEIFPRFGVKVRGGIKRRTAMRWMKAEGFAYKAYAKGVYVEYVLLAAPLSGLLWAYQFLSQWA
jgi:hypothetical protein